jgi:cell division protein FtsB
MKKHDKSASIRFEKTLLAPRAACLPWRLSPVNFRKFILGLYAVLFGAVALWAASFFVQMERELTTLRWQERAGLQRLAEAEARLQAQEKYLDQLRHDPALVERLIRQKLGYVRSQEYVFRFEAGLESTPP